MDTIIWLLIILITLNFLLKQTFWTWKANLCTAIAAAAFAMLMWRYAIQQSKTQIADWLNNPALMLDTSVILTAEVALQMAFCLLSVHVANMSPIKKRTRWMHRALYWFPGVLILPVLFWGLTQLIFALPGISFKAVAGGFALFVLIILPLGRWLMLKAMPEPDSRLEFLFLANAMVAILGIVATVNGQTAVEGVSSVDWGAFIGCVAIFLAGGACGLLIWIVKRKLKY